MNSLTKQKSLPPSIKTPQELVHIKHKISLRQYKYWILALRAYRENYEASKGPDDSGFHRISLANVKELIGYEPVRAELRSDFEALRKEPIIYNVLSKDGKTAQRGSGFISEWEVSANWIGFKLPGFLVDCIERLDLKNAMFQALNWSVFDSFSGKYEAILYKLCKDYVGVQRTPYMAIATFRDYMGLNDSEYAEFKDLNKFVISGPVKKINASRLADITIAANFKKESRRVVGVQFDVKLRHQAVMGFGDDPVFSMARVTISMAQQKKYLSEKTQEEIALAIERANAYADEQEQSGKPVSLGALYHTAITQGWGLEYKSKLAREEKKRAKQPAPAPEGKRAGSGFDAPNPGSNQAMAKFEALPLADQKRILERFSETLKGPLKKTYENQGLGSQIIRGSLAGWLARDSDGKDA
ncbi:MAG: replication initiation protein [Sulfuritalea sp.]|nr:replication initiation protein [Sulfuritalea sp.]